jgi:hypothetical protein
MIPFLARDLPADAWTMASTGRDGLIPNSAKAGGSMPHVMTAMGEMPTPRLHACMMPATFVAPRLVATAAVMTTASGDDRMNRIDDTARSCRALRRALGRALGSAA